MVRCLSKFIFVHRGWVPFSDKILSQIKIPKVAAFVALKNFSTDEISNLDCLVPNILYRTLLDDLFMVQNCGLVIVAVNFGPICDFILINCRSWER